MLFTFPPYFKRDSSINCAFERILKLFSKARETGVRVKPGVEPKASTSGHVRSAIKPVKRAAVLLGLTPHASCCRLLRRLKWVVERSFGWMSRFRRLAREYERLPATLAGLHYVAFVILMLKNVVGILA